MSEQRSGDGLRGQKGGRGRVGRPTREEVGEVDVRLLEAAAEMFLTEGYERTSCERIAERARAGKASLYARYPNKAALFAAVVRFELDRSRPEMAEEDLSRPLAERLASVGRRMHAQAMSPSRLALLRLLIAEAQHLPEVVREASQLCSAQAVECVLRVMLGSSLPDPDAVERTARAAGLFVDLVLPPLQLRALLGDGSPSDARSVDERIDAALGGLERLGLLGTAVARSERGEAG